MERTDWTVQNHRQEPGGKGSPQQPPFNLERRDGGWWLGEVQVSGFEAWAKLAVPPSLGTGPQTGIQTPTRPRE